MTKKRSLLENVFVLILVGVLAGVAAGAAVGIVTGKTASTNSAAH